MIIINCNGHGRVRFILDVGSGKRLMRRRNGYFSLLNGYLSLLKLALNTMP